MVMKINKGGGVSTIDTRMASSCQIREVSFECGSALGHNIYRL